MTIHDFDTLASGLSTLEVPEATQRRHLAMLADLLADNTGTYTDDTALSSAETSTGPIQQTTTAEPSAESFAEPTAGAAEATAPRDNVLRPQFSRRRRTALIAGSVVVLVGAGIGTAAAFGAFSEPTDRGTSHCYTAADLDAAHNDFMLATTSGKPGDAAAEALEICSRDWANGRLQLGASQVDEPDESGRTYPVPPLAVCVLESGQVGVFPGNEDTCHQLGLPIADL